jgi:hypothetical protein
MSEAASKNDSKNEWALVAEVSPRVEIQDIRLMESVVRPKLLDDKLPELIHYGFGTSTTLKEQDAGKEPKVIVSVHFELIGMYKEIEPDTERLRIEATFRLTYSLTSPAGLDQKHFLAFGELNGVYNAFPYWREFVQNSTARMGLPVLTIPLFKLASSTSEKNTRATEPKL